MKTPRGRAVGSSPLTRGALIGVRARTPQTAHPRLRGEHIFSLQLGLALLGSSPLTRGARFVFGGFVIRHRLIPAYAGSTVEFPLFRCLPGAHPRLRGEHGLAPVYTGNTLGSSPLTRGAPARKVPPARAHGLIPAYAGSTTTARIYAAGLGAHPRLRGEHTVRLILRILPWGSSPLTRGAPVFAPAGACPSRLIPAYAGSTSRRWSRRAGTAAHPRLRGEHRYLITRSESDTGSSPLTRGARTMPQALGTFGRLIPAYAGSTRGRVRGYRRGKAHPRLRGEHRGDA